MFFTILHSILKNIEKFLSLIHCLGMNLILIGYRLEVVFSMKIIKKSLENVGLMILRDMFVKMVNGVNTPI